MAKRKDDPKTVDKLIAAASLCANCCYNISRNFSYDLPDHVRESMQSSQKQFDNAVRELRESRKSFRTA